MASYIPQQVQQLYGSFDQQLINNLPKIYRADIVFQDPMQRIEGLNNLTRYFERMMTGLQECRFEFSQVIESNSAVATNALTSSPAQSLRIQQAVLFWVMHYRHQKLAGGKPLTITGNSHIKYQDKVIYHRDYFDAGAMLYEHLPIMGFAIKQIKKWMEY